jgi:hypothetical protein
MLCIVEVVKMPTTRASKQINWVSQAASPLRLFALVLCLLLSQALGLMHEHAPHTDHHDHQRGMPFEAVASGVHISWVADLFAGHSEESTCQVFEQLSHGSALLGHVADIGQLALSSFFLDTYRGATPAYKRSLAQARGPPAFLDFFVIV